MDLLFQNLLAITPAQIFMLLLGCLLLYLAIAKQMEPTLLLPMGFGVLMVNLPFSGAISQTFEGTFVQGILDLLFESGIATELFPLLIFIGIGAMIDFGPLLQRPFMIFFGAAAQFGIFFTIIVAMLLGFDIRSAASIGIIGAADGPTSIFVSSQLAPHLLGPISVAAYSYMALVPIIQPFAIKLVTTKKERHIRMTYEAATISKKTRLLFPIIVTFIAGIVAPASIPLIGFLMFGNLLRESGVVERLSQSAQNELVNVTTILLGLAIASTMRADTFVTPSTFFIIGLGLVAFIFDTIGGVCFVKLVNLFRKDKINPMIGAAGISAFPMSARTIQKMAQKEDPHNFVLMHSISANVAGQIASVIAGGLVLAYLL
ncbi:MAG: sodium ion-translocating decarboxylase subunit beta [Cellulosilyticaceae bacterium]